VLVFIFQTEEKSKADLMVLSETTRHEMHMNKKVPTPACGPSSSSKSLTTSHSWF
jgi:hypothetical protein